MSEFAYQSASEMLTDTLQDRYKLFFSKLSEPQKRWFAALESERLGYGGTKAVCELFEMSPTTVSRGRRELDNGLTEYPSDRIRKPGSGRPKSEKKTLQSKTISRRPSNR